MIFLDLWKFYSGMKADPKDIPFEEITFDEITADLYSPPVEKGPFPGMLLCHGITENGKSDDRLRKIAHAFRAIGFCVLVPEFVEAKNFLISPKMIADISVSLAHLCALDKTQENNCGIFAISHGATLSFCAASQKHTRDRIAWLISLGAYYSFEDLIEYSYSEADPPPNPYLREVMHKNIAADIPISNITKEMLHEKGKNFAQMVSIDNLDLSKRTSVILMHASNDTIVPMSQMKKFEQELSRIHVPYTATLISLSAHANLPTFSTSIGLFDVLKQIFMLRTPKK